MSEKELNISISSDSRSESPEQSKEHHNESTENEKLDNKTGCVEKTSKNDSDSNSVSNSSTSNSSSSSENLECENANLQKVNSLVEEIQLEESEVIKLKKRKIYENEAKNNKKPKGIIDAVKENPNDNITKNTNKSPYNPEGIDISQEHKSPIGLKETTPQQENNPIVKKIELQNIMVDKEISEININKTSRSNEKDPEKNKSRRRSRSPKGHRKSRSPKKISDTSVKRDREIRSDHSKRRYSRSTDRERSNNNKETTRYRSRSPRNKHDRKKSGYSYKDNREKRKRSKSPTKDKKLSREDGEILEDSHPDSEITPRQRKTVDILTSRTGGAYIPPAKLRMLQNEITDKSSAAYQRIAWEALKKSIHGYINKVNVDNIGIITRELLRENIVRGRGLLCRSIIQAQAASPTFTHVYGALVAIINSKFPNIGELLLKRLVIQFKRGFRRNDKMICLSSSRFIAHLVNQRVAHEILALEILTLLVETPTDDSVEVAIAFLKECGMKLTEVSSKGINAIFEMLKNILHEGKLDKRVQYMIEVVFQVRKDGFKDHQSVVEALELVEEEDQYTHLIMLDEATETQDQLNVFKFDDKYQENEGKYKGLSKELLGSDEDVSGSGSENGSDGSDEDEDDDEENDEDKKATIIDNTETNLIALRRTIYLTIHSSLDYEECAHKLMKMQLKPGQEMELCHMFLDCCAEQRTYEKFYGLLAQRFCNINKIYIQPFEEIFKDTYSTTHRLDTNRLRNVSKFFAHLLFTDAISWEVMESIRLNEDDTTSSSRIFIKILFQELAEYMGLGKLNERLKDITLSESFSGLFPRDNPRNTRFAINFFTSIGLGGLTDALREFLKSAPKSVPAINHEIFDVTDTSSSSSSSTSSSSSSSSSSDSESDRDKKKKTNNNKKKKNKSGKNKINDKKNKLKINKNKKKMKSSSSSSTSSSSSDNSSDTSDSSNSSSSSSGNDKKSKRTKKQKILNTKNNKKYKSNLEMKKINENPFKDAVQNHEKTQTIRREERNRNEENAYGWGRTDNSNYNRNNDRDFDRGRLRHNNPFRADRYGDSDKVERNENRWHKSREHDKFKDYDKPQDNFKNNDRNQNRYNDHKEHDGDTGERRADRIDKDRYRDEIETKETSRRNRSKNSNSNRGISKERG